MSHFPVPFFKRTVRASALYIVIIISLAMAVLCSSLIVTALFFKNENLRSRRYVRLKNNLSSGINLLLTSGDTLLSNNPSLSLFGNESDSVSLRTTVWGIYDIGIVKAYLLKDTLRKAFTFARKIDSVKWAALYLADRDRALSLSGETSIVGNAFLPKAGIKKAYAAGKGYLGDENLIEGHQYLSQKLLPKLFENRLIKLQQYFDNRRNLPVTDSILKNKDSLINSFFNPPLLLNFGKKAGSIKSLALSGNIICYSDTTLTIDSSARLDNVMVFAKTVIVKSKFHGKCQLFARDSICVESDCNFKYPSCLGIISTGKSSSSATKITVGENSKVTGVVFTYSESDDQIMPIIALNKNVILTGQIYSQGMISYKGNLNIQGSVATKLFIIQSNSNLIENLLIDATINFRNLSPYFLSGELFNESRSKKEILQWLE